MKILLLKLARFTPLVVGFIGLNLFVDPAKIFLSARFERKIAQILVDGKNIALLGGDHNERIFQKFWIGSLKKNPPMIALGSSRIMQIRQSDFPNEIFVNNAVSGATLEDLLGIYFLYENRGFKLKKILVSLDPWMLNAQNRENRWIPLNLEFRGMLGKLDLSNEKANYKEILKYRIRCGLQLISLEYFQSSMKLFVEQLKLRIPDTYIVIDKLNPNYSVLAIDGSFFYPQKNLNRSPEQVDDLARLYIKDEPIYHLGGFNEISRRDLRILDHFIGYLCDQSVQVTLVLLPYHPKVWNFLINSEKYKIVTVAEESFRSLAKKYSIRAIGSFDPGKYNLEGKDFIDGMHCKESALQAILRSAGLF